jgi:hypothetical protein
MKYTILYLAVLADIEHYSSVLADIEHYSSVFSFDVFILITQDAYYIIRLLLACVN